MPTKHFNTITIMKKNLFYFLATILLSSVTISLTACNDDDDEDGGGGSGIASKTVGIIDSKTGQRITKFGNYKVYYDADGRLDYIADSNGKWTFSYNPNKITFVESSNGQDKGETVNVSYNGNGYISALSSSYTFEEYGMKFSETSKATLSYDGSGHLTKITSSSKMTGSYNGESYSDTYSSNYTLTWKSGQLTKVVGIESGNEDGESYSDTDTWTFSYSDSYPNTFQQWAPSIAQSFSGDMVEVLCYVGLLGVGPSQLPGSAEDVYVEDDDTDTDSYTFNYGFNDNGSLSYSTINGIKYTFSYDYADTRALTEAIPAPEKKVSHKALSRFFNRTHGR